MDIRSITADYAVSQQIEPEHMAVLAREGFTTVINNRPDAENPPELQSAAMRTAAEAAGLIYVANPVVNGGLTLEMVQKQGEAVNSSAGPVFAWCRSGTRSSIVWALSQAGQMPSDQSVGLLSDAGYDIPGLGQQIEALAAR